MVELAEIFRRHWPAYEQKYGSRLLPSHRRAVSAILHCRTQALGGHLYRCEPCALDHYVYHSCNHRACPKCGHQQATAWIQKQKAYLLPAAYFLVTFTVPAQLRRFFRSAQKFWYEFLFRQSSGTLADVASRQKYLGGQLGMMGILQTWTRDLRYHPHVHYLVPGIGLSLDGHRCVRTGSADYLLPEKVLAARFRNRFRRHLSHHHPELFKAIPAKVWKLQWVVDVLAVGSGEAALKYLSAYTYKTAITGQRLLASDEHSVSFRYRDADTGQWQTCQLPGERFMHRFLQHILPRGFQRVRYYGWRSPAAHQRWEKILGLLSWKPPLPSKPPPLGPQQCPRCAGPMTWLGRLPRVYLNSS